MTSNDDEGDLIRRLFETLQRRPVPEDVAEMVGKVLGADLNAVERVVLKEASHYHGWAQVFPQWPALVSRMLGDFRRPIAPTRSLSVAKQLFETAAAFDLRDGDELDPDRITAFTSHLSAELRRPAGAGDFMAHRLDRAARKDAGLPHSKRQYNKRFRLLSRLSGQGSHAGHRTFHRAPRCGRLCDSGLCAGAG